MASTAEDVKVKEDEEENRAKEVPESDSKPPSISNRKLKKEEQTTTTTKPSKLASTPTPTVNLSDFLSLLSPQAVEKCLCCNSSLQSTLPASLFYQEKVEVLKSFCNILNLPFALEVKENVKANGGTNGNPEDDEEDSEDEADAIDFPFCLQCFKDKAKKLIQIYEKLMAIQKEFEKMKETVMGDILRVFISNMVSDKKIPVAVVREKKVHEKMLEYFKRHSEKRMKNLTDGETQTDAPVQQFFPSYAPIMQNYSGKKESSNYQGRWGGRKRRGGGRKINNTSYTARQLKNQSRRDSANYYESHTYPPSNNSEGTDNTQDINSNMSNDMPNLSSFDYGSYPPGGNQNSVDGYNNISGSVVNGMVFDDNGLLNLHEEYFNNYGYDIAHNSNSYVNGFDQSCLNDEFNNVLGLVDGPKFPGTGLAGRRDSFGVTDSSPPKLDQEFPYSSEHQVVTSTNNKLKIRKVGKNAVVECDICRKQLTKESMKSHMETFHNEEKPYKCRGCDKKFARRDHWREHEERHVLNLKRGFFCHRCGEGSGLIIGKSTYVEHCMTVHKVEDEVVEYFHFCDAEECFDSFKVKEDFLNHLVTHWDLGYTLQCSICDKSFADRNNLESHEQVAHSSMEQYFGCNFCHMGFTDEIDYSKHISFHHVKMPAENIFECDVCGKSCPSSSRLRSHKYNAHIYKGKSKASDESSPVKRRKKSMQCKICKKSYTSEKRLEKHMLKHEEEDEDEDIPEEDDEDIEMQEVESQSGDEQEDNEPADDDEGASENEEANEDEEFEKAEPEEIDDSKAQGNIECEYCSKKLKTRLDARKHLVKAHSDKCLTKGAKSCSVCWYIFKSEAKLQEHIDLKHSKLKCEECGLLCVTVLNLKQHMKRHNPDLHFVCDICKQRFGSQWVLQRHKNIVHLKQKKVKIKVQVKPKRTKRRRYSTRRTTVSEDEPEESSNASNNDEDDE